MSLIILAARENSYKFIQIQCTTVATFFFRRGRNLATNRGTREGRTIGPQRKRNPRRRVAKVFPLTPSSANDRVNYVKRA